MTVTFTLDYRHCRDATPRVVYGHDWHPGRVASGKEFSQLYVLSHWRIFESAWIYHVTLQNLNAGNKEYWYRIVVDPGVSTTARTQRQLRGMLTQEESPSLQFTTPPMPGSPTTIALIGDLGQTINSTKTMAHIHRATRIAPYNPHPVSLVLIVGDMSYATPIHIDGRVGSNSWNRCYGRRQSKSLLGIMK
jgi:hypothetical protein